MTEATLRDRRLLDLWVESQGFMNLELSQGFIRRIVLESFCRGEMCLFWKDRQDVSGLACCGFGTEIGWGVVVNRRLVESRDLPGDGSLGLSLTTPGE